MTDVAVVGPGRVGTALALALPRHAYRVVAVAGRGAARLDSFCARVPSARAAPLPEATRAAELVLVCVSDDRLHEVVRAAARDEGVAERSRWVHTAGGYGHDALRPARLAGAAVAACHPAQTFPDPDTGLAALDGTAWAVTAAELDLGWAEALVRDLRGRPFHVPARSRTLYHVALSLGANAAAAVVTLARDLLHGAGIEDPASFLDPLVSAATGGAVHAGAAALTGPVRRGDAGTVAAHLHELRVVFPEAVDTYVCLARLALGQARRAGLDPAAAAAVAAVLNPEE